MSITQHQFEQLNEMGISLWQRRSCDTNDDKTQKSADNLLDIDLTALASQQLFTDIILAMGVTLGEITQQEQHLNLGLFNWYFTASQAPQRIQWQDHQLFTPPLNIISKSPALKKQLWHLLGIQA